MALLHVHTTINGEPAEYLCEPDESLLTALRDRLGLTGTKEGCATGDCGACSVIMNGRLVPSCLVLAPEAEEAAIDTIEGVAHGESLHPLQQQFLEHAALQCGVCTPGFIVAAKALLDRNPSPSETDVRYALAGNLCRCTGYDKIIRAVLAAATEVRHLSASVTPEAERNRASAEGRDRSVTKRAGVGRLRQGYGERGRSNAEARPREQ